MQIKEVMTRDVIVVSPETSIAYAATQMATLDVGTLPVCDGARLVGMITDRDVTARAAAAGRDPESTPVRAVMTLEVAYCFEDQDVQEAAALMRARKVRRLVVLDRDQRFVGIVALGDLAVTAGEAKTPIETLTRIVEPAAPKR